MCLYVCRLCVVMFGLLAGRSGGRMIETVAPPDEAEPTCSDLFHAVHQGDVKQAAHWIDGGADVNAKGGFREHTLLHEAIWWGHIELVKLLLGKGADVNSRDGSGRTPLHTAIECGYLEVVELLLQKGADVNAEAEGAFEGESGETPLDCAVRNRFRPAVSLLIQSGARLNYADAEEDESLVDYTMRLDDRKFARLLVALGAETSIHTAAYTGDAKRVMALVDSGVEVDKLYEGDRTPLHFAAGAGNLEVVKVLVARGANVNARTIYRETPLLKAARHGHRDIVVFLLAHGADVNATSNLDDTPLLAAVQEGYKEIEKLLLAKGAEVTLYQAASVGDLDRVRRLMNHGADFNAPCGVGSRLIHEAAFGGHNEVVLLLLEKGADVNLRDARGRTPIHMAALGGHIETVALLLSKGAEVNVVDHFHETPLRVAAREGHKGLAALLIAKGAGVNGVYGRTTALWDATHQGHTEIVELLLSKGADANGMGPKGDSPLPWAAYFGHSQIVKLLLARGADVHAKNADGKTALECASSAGFADILALLGGNPDDPSVLRNKAYRIRVTGPQATERFLRAADIEFDTIWIPQESDLVEYDSSLKAYIQKDWSTESDMYRTAKNLLPRFRRYNREYSGFVKDGVRYVVCNMVPVNEANNQQPQRRFSMVFGLGGDTYKVVFKAESKNVERIDHN